VYDILCILCVIFTALHGMHSRYSDEKAVCPSVKRVNCDKTEERSVQIVIPYDRSFILVFREEEWLLGVKPFYLKFWANSPPPLERNCRFSTDIRP